MKLIFPFFLASLSIAAGPMAAQAKISVNDAQACQAVLDFTIERVESVVKYDKADVAVVTKGLRAYEAFLQSNHVTPGLLEITNGDQIFTDQAVSINNCYTNAPMGEESLQMMTDAVQGIVELARQG